MNSKLQNYYYNTLMQKKGVLDSFNTLRYNKAISHNKKIKLFNSMLCSDVC